MPEMILLERLKSGSWSAPETALQMAPPMAPANGAFNGAWTGAWRLEMAPENGATVACLLPTTELTPKRRPSPASLKSALQGRHNVARKALCLPSTCWGWSLFCLIFYSFWWDELIEDKSQNLIFIKQWF